MYEYINNTRGMPFIGPCAYNYRTAPLPSCTSNPPCPFYIRLGTKLPTCSHCTIINAYHPNHVYLKSSLSFSQLPMNVPNWHEYTWSCSVSRYRSLNWKARGYCCINCHVQSMNCVKTGDVSFGSTVPRRPQRSVNLWPNESHSFSIRFCVKQIGNGSFCFLVLLYSNIFLYHEIELIIFCINAHYKSYSYIFKSRDLT